MKTVIYVLLLIGLAFSGHAQQECRSETEIFSSTPNSRFVDVRDGTIFDIGTGLMWQKCSLGLSGHNCEIGTAIRYNWKESLETAQTNSLAGYSDWRLPNVKELSSIVERRCHNPSINDNYFPKTKTTTYWSSSPITDLDSEVWLVNFSFGITTAGGNVREYGRYVRLVRSGL